MHNAVTGVAKAVRTESAMLPVATQSQGESEVAEAILRLVIERQAIVGHGEFAAKQKLARIPHDGIGGVGIVALLLD